MIQATVRHRLSRDDAQLIARLIARDSGQPVDEIEQAISDQGIDAVLDDPRLPAALMRAGQGACARGSCAAHRDRPRRRGVPRASRTPDRPPR